MYWQPRKRWLAAIIIIDGEKKIITGKKDNTTNNQMELLATIKALQEIPHESEIEIFTDSKYVKNGITEWILNWKKMVGRLPQKKKF